MAVVADAQSPAAWTRRLTGRPARLLHPGAWWLWALGLAVAAMRTTDLLLLVEIAAVASLVVAARRGPASWANAYGLLLKLGLATLAITTALQIVIGVRAPGHVLVRLPSLALPSWLDGLSLGGPVTAEALLNAVDAGLRLAVLIACFGAANALAHPARLVRILPAALYELGVVVVVAMTFVPQLAESLARVRAAQRLRGRRITGLRGLRGLAVPILEDSLDGAIALAASMDSRGYGRRSGVAAARRRLSGAVLLVGLGAALAGTYQVIGGGGWHGLGPGLVAAGALVALGSGLVSGRRGRRTRYRPDPWRWPEWAVAGCGVLVAAVYLLDVHASTAAGVALSWPRLQPLAFAAAALAVLPAVLAPPVPGRAGAGAVAARVPA